MSQAFVRESDEMSLQEVSPSLSALIVYLTRENNGVRVYEKQVARESRPNRELHVMSNGLTYAKDENSKWYVI